MTAVRVAAMTDIGRRRALNEDAFLVGEGLFVVADGMGGHAAGDVASRLTVESLRRADGPLVEVEDVRRAVAAANAAVLQYAQANGVQRGMGCTVAGLGLVQSGGQPHWAVFNLGDSRVYVLTGNAFRQVTTDHSEVQEMVDAGLLTPDQARTHPQRNVITRAVGEPSPAPLDVVLLPAVGGQRLLVATDGLTCEMSDPEIRGVLQDVPDPDEAVRLLIAGALDAGGRDNVTVVVVDVVGSQVDHDPDSVSTTIPRELIDREVAR